MSVIEGQYVDPAGALSFPPVKVDSTGALVSAVPRNAAAITPNDSNDLSPAPQQVRITGTGDVKVTTAGGQTLTFTGWPANTFLPVLVSRVWSTGTTATGLIGFY